MLRSSSGFWYEIHTGNGWPVHGDMGVRHSECEPCYRQAGELRLYLEYRAKDIGWNFMHSRQDRPEIVRIQSDQCGPGR